MQRCPRLMVIAAMVSLAGCAAQTSATKPDAAATTAATADTPSDGVDQRLLREGMQLIAEGRIREAVEGPFDDIIRRYETQYRDSKHKIYSARGATDALLYAALAASAEPPEPATVLGPAWAMAYWARGYAYNEMARYDDAIAELNKALALAPVDSQYTMELAFAHQQKRDWERALALYQSAFAYAELSATDIPEMQCKALRGQGYNLVELHRFDEAKVAYNECLKLKPDEPKSLGELNYIEQQLKPKAKQPS